jgi:tRNA threonylcarbamoyl adenosine modification protein YeaZ
MPDRFILALDAAGDACSVALGVVTARGVEVRAAEKVLMKHGHATALVPMIDTVMKQAGIALADVLEIAVGNGPGGFTGLRIALATARGLGLALGKPVLGISNFQAAAAQLPVTARQGLAGGDILVMIDSRREEPYVARLDADLLFRTPPRFMTLEEIAADIAAHPPATVTGDGIDLWHGIWPDATMRQPAAADALSILSLAADSAHPYAAQPLPLYLRPADVSQPKASSPSGAR